MARQLIHDKNIKEEMTERQIVLLIQVTLSLIKDMQDSGSMPGPFDIRSRLRMYDKNLDEFLREDDFSKRPPSAARRLPRPGATKPGC